MAVAQDSNQPLKVVNLAQEEPVAKYASRGFWLDAWRRLRRNKLALMGIAIILANIFAAIFAPYVAPQSYEENELIDSNTAPEWVTKVFPTMTPDTEEQGYIRINNDYLLGADNVGRDILSRIIYGARVSLTVAFVGPMVSLAVGLFLGMISGYLGGWVDDLIMRAVDIMYAFPTILLIILMMAYFRASFTVSEEGTLAYTLNKIDAQFGGMLFIFIGIGLTSWMGTARLARGQVLSLREQEYIQAARSIGSNNQRIIWRHILPNALGPIVVAETLTIPTYISYEAFLSFIGLGVNRPTPSWGSMISDGATAISTYPNQAIFPAMALFFIMFAFNFLGDGLRDALDPHTKQG